MFLDLQFSFDKFSRLLRREVQRALPVVTDEFNNPKAGGDKLLVDHLHADGIVIDTDTDSISSAAWTVTGPSGPVEIQGPAVQLIIRIDASLTTRGNVIAAGHLGVPAIVNETPIPFWVKAKLKASAASGALVLTLDPVDVGTYDSTFTFSDDEKKKLKAKIEPINHPIVLPAMAGQPMTVYNAGLVTQGGVVAILAEVTPPGPDTVLAWANFFTGQFTPRSGDWSLVLPKELIVAIVDAAVADAVGTFPAKDDRIEVLLPPVTEWQPPGVQSQATINVHDVCPVGASNVEVQLDFIVTFAVSNGAIEVTVEVLWQLSDWDVARCAAATGLLAGTVAAVIAGPAGAILAVVSSIIAFIVTVVAVSDESHGQLSEGVSVDPGELDLHVVEQNDEHAVIKGQLALGNLVPGMTPATIQAAPAGLQLDGTFSVALPQRALESSGESSFDWDSGYSCSKDQWVLEQIEAKLGLRTRTITRWRPRWRSSPTRRTPTRPT